MKRYRLLLIIAAVILILAAFYMFQPSRTPTPQPPLVTLNSANFAASFYGAINNKPQGMRLVLLLSPT